MARRIVHQLVDDLDGTVLDVGAGETVLFSIDGVAYEIDLTDENAAALREAFSPFVAAARSVSARAGSSGRASTANRGGSAETRGSSRTQRRAGQRDYAPVRAWASENGYTLSERGRVPAAVLEAYDAAH